MSKRIAYLTAAAFSALAITATVVAPVRAEEKTVMVGGAAMFPSKNIVQNAVNSKDHTTLVAAVKAAGLVPTLEGKGPFTVFAPTNAAFGKLPAGTVDTLVKPENKATLTKILTYHVVAGKLEASARTLLGLAGLLSFENQYPQTLSGGMKQRVGIVRALATGPKVLLLDEPFGALDAQTRVIMQQILTNMWQRLKISVLFVTHDIDEAIFLSDRVYCMTARPGSIKAEIPIPLERPRQQSMMMSSEFLALRRGLMSLIREESLKAMGGEISDMGMQGLNIELHGHSLADVI